MRETAAKIAEYALLVGKDVILEDLDFKLTKARREKGRNIFDKKRNKDLHDLDYNRYMETVERACLFRGIDVRRVPAYCSSKNGYKKYSESKKLTIHQSASLVIARRGQGLRD